MLLAYLDESSTRDRYWIAALLLSAAGASVLTSALDDIMERAASTYGGIDSNAELHGYPLMHGKGAWEPLRSLVRARISIYQQALQAINENAEAILIRGVKSLLANCGARESRSKRRPAGAGRWPK